MRRLNDHDYLDGVFKSMNKKLDLSEREQNEMYANMNSKLQKKPPRLKRERKLYYWSLALAGILCLILVLPSFTSLISGGHDGNNLSEHHSYDSSGENVILIVEEYLEALESKDIETLVNLSFDTRYSSKEEQKEDYLTIDDEVTETQIVDVQRISDNEYLAAVEFISNGELIETKFPVRKLEGDWTIIVGHDL